MEPSRVVLHVIPTLGIGGAERQLVALVNKQSELGIQVHVALRRKGAFRELIKKDLIVVHEIGDYRGLDLRLMLNLVRLIKKIDPDVVQSWLPQMDIIAGIACNISRVLWVATERTSVQFYKTNRAPIANWLREKIVRFSDAIVANSDSGAEMWKAILPGKKNISKIRNMVDLEGIQESISSKECGTNSSSYILVAGRLVKSKSIELIISAFERLPKAPTLRLRIIGNGPLEATITKRINDSRYHDRIELITKDTVSWWGYLQTCRMFISMSHYEGNPNAVLEAMAGGCPLIVSNISAHHEILDTNSALFVDLDKIEDLVKAIVNVDSEYSEALKRSSNARASVMKMTDTKMALEYESVYSNL